VIDIRRSPESPYVWLYGSRTRVHLRFTREQWLAFREAAHQMKRTVAILPGFFGGMPDTTFELGEGVRLEIRKLPDGNFHWSMTNQTETLILTPAEINTLREMLENEQNNPR
jgi:hypothetical protein